MSETTVTRCQWGSLELRFEWVMENQRWICAGFGIEPAAGRAVTASLLREIPLAGLVRGERRKLADASGLPGRARAIPGRGKRYGLAHAHYLAVAHTYAAAWRAGEPPTAAVAAAFGVSQPTAARWISRARNRYQFLAPTRWGAANGELTPKALDADEVAQ